MEYLKRIENNFTITFKDILYQVKINDKDTNTEYFKTIINNISGQAKSGELTAIMGPSGSGKTSLLNFITSRINFLDDSKHTGEMYLNEKTLEFDDIGHYSGYVMQDDCLFSTLTPEENLRLALKLKHLTEEEHIEDCVEKFLKDLQIYDCKDTFIGDAELKGISGGERKRVSIGMELVSNPSILFLDEPTSGLDSQTSLKIVSLLKKLAIEKNMIIVCTIHQPSSNIFNIFDKLIVIERGNIIYNDSPDNIYDYFEKLQKPLNAHANPADCFMRILEQNSKTLNRDFFIDSFQSKNSESNKQIESYLAETNLGINIFSKAEDKASTYEQIIILSGRAYKNMLRNSMLIRMRTYTTIVFSFFCASVFWLLPGDTYEGVNGRIGFIFFIITHIFYEQIYGNLLSFPCEKPIFIREYYAKMYNVFPYYVAKNIVESPINLFLMMIFCIIVYFTAGLRTDADNFFIYFGATMLFTICSQSIAYFMGAVFSSVEQALGTANTVIQPVLIFSGTLINVNSIPRWLAWFQYLSPLKYINEIGVTNEFDGNKEITYEGGWKEALDNMNFDMGIGWCFAILGFMAVLFRVLGYFFLKMMISKTG